MLLESVNTPSVTLGVSVEGASVQCLCSLRFNPGIVGHRGLTRVVAVWGQPGRPPHIRWFLREVSAAVFASAVSGCADGVQSQVPGACLSWLLVSEVGRRSRTHTKETGRRPKSALFGVVGTVSGHSRACAPNRASPPPAGTATHCGVSLEPAFHCPGF